MLHVAEHHPRFAHVHTRILDDLQIQPDLVPRQEPPVAVISHRLLPRRLERHPTLPRSKALLPQSCCVALRPRQAPQRLSSLLREVIYAARTPMRRHKVSLSNPQKEDRDVMRGRNADSFRYLQSLGYRQSYILSVCKSKSGVPTNRVRCEVPECLREVFDPVVADEVDLCLRTAGVKRSIKPFAKPRCQMTKPIERERKHIKDIKDNVSPLTVSLHPCRSVLIGVHVCSRVLETKARQQSSRSVIVRWDGREDLLNPLAFLQ